MNNINEEAGDDDDGRMKSAPMRMVSWQRAHRKHTEDRNRRVTHLLQVTGDDDDSVLLNRPSTVAANIALGSYEASRIHSVRRSSVRRKSVSLSVPMDNKETRWEQYKKSQIGDPHFRVLYDEVMKWYIVLVQICGFLPLNIISDEWVERGTYKKLRRGIQLYVNWSWFSTVLLSLYYLTAWQSCRLFRDDASDPVIFTASLMYVGVDFYGIGILLSGVLMVYYQRLVQDSASNYMTHIQFPMAGRIVRDGSTVDISLVRLGGVSDESVVDSYATRQIHFREWRRLQISVNSNVIAYTILSFVSGSLVIYFVLVERGLWIHEECREHISPVFCGMLVTFGNYIFTLIVCTWTALVWISTHILYRSCKHLRRAIVDVINEGHKQHVSREAMENLVAFLGDWLSELAAGKRSLELYLVRFFVPALFVMIFGTVMSFLVLVIISRGTFPEDLAYFTAPCVGLLLWSLLLTCLSRFFRVYNEIDELMFLLFCPDDTVQRATKRMSISEHGPPPDFDKTNNDDMNKKNKNKNDFFGSFRFSVSDTLGQGFSMGSSPSQSRKASNVSNQSTSRTSASAASTTLLRRGSFIQYVSTQKHDTRMDMFKRQREKGRTSSESEQHLEMVTPSSGGSVTHSRRSSISFSFNVGGQIPHEHLMEWGMVSNAYEPAPQIAHRILAVYWSVARRVLIGVALAALLVCTLAATQYYAPCVKLDLFSEKVNDSACSNALNVFRVLLDTFTTRSAQVLLPTMLFGVGFGTGEALRIWRPSLGVYVLFLITHLCTAFLVGSEDVRYPSDVFFVVNVAMTQYFVHERVDRDHSRWWLTLGCVLVVCVMNIQRFLVIFDYNRATNDNERVVIIFAVHPFLSVAATTLITSIMRRTHTIPGMKNHFTMFAVMAFMVYPIQRFYIINLSSVVVQLKSSTLVAFLEVISRTISLFMPYLFWLVWHRSHVKALAEIELTRLHVVNRHHICMNMMVEIYSILLAPIVTQIVRMMYDRELIPWFELSYVIVLQLVFSVFGDVLAIAVESVYLERKVLPLWNYFLHTGRYVRYGLVPAICVSGVLLCRDIVVVILSVSQ